MATPDLSVSRHLLDHLDQSPTPYHAVAEAAALLEDGGFAELEAGERLSARPGRGFTRQGGALVAWAVDDGHSAETGLRIVGAHTDSPNLRVKPRPDAGAAGWRQLGVEIYGGALLNSWLDRDLGLAGRISVRDGDGATVRLFRDDRPLLRVPQLAIHLDGEIRERGLLLNAQQHMAPVWGLGEGPDFRSYLADRVDVAPDDVLAWEAMAHDLTPAALAGLDEEFLASGRIDNLLSCFLAVRAICDAPPGPHIAMVALFDHEEVGSVTATGAASPLLVGVVERLGHALGGDVEARHRSRADSVVLSADGAHATHPNYVDRHEPDHRIAVNAGPGPEGQRQSALRHRRRVGRRVPAGLRSGRRAGATVREPHRPGVRLDDRAAHRRSVGRVGGRRGLRAAGHALGARDVRQPRPRLVPGGHHRVPRRLTARRRRDDGSAPVAQGPQRWRRTSTASGRSRGARST